MGGREEGGGKEGGGMEEGGGTSKFSKLGGRCATPPEREGRGKSGQRIPSGDFPSVTLPDPHPACASVSLSARHLLWSENVFPPISIILQK